MRQTHLPERLASLEDGSVGTLGVKTDDISGVNKMDGEVIHCRTNESMKSRDEENEKTGEDNDKQDCKNENINIKIEEIQNGIKVLKNVFTIICMAYHLAFRGIEGKPSILKSIEKYLQFSSFAKGFDKSIGKGSFIKGLLNSKIDCHQNIKVFPVSLNNYFDSLTSGLSMPLDESMSNNLLRIYSFSSFPRNVNIFTSLFAKAGFYYTGVSDEVRCYACGLSYKNWSSADKPLEIHRRLSPSCSHVIRLNLEHDSEENVSGSSNNLNTSIPSLLSVTNTDSTLHYNNLSNPNSTIVSHNLSSLSENGSYITSSLSTNVLNTTNGLSGSKEQHQLQHCTETETNVPSVNRVENSWNENILNGKHNQNDIGASNATPERCISTGSSAGRNAIVEVNGDEAKYPNYGPIQIRISSFQGWPSYLDQTPHVMAKAGFLYAGYNDYTRCFFCAGGLRNWEAGDDPWIEHARWFPNCRYLKENKGERFIKAVQNKQAQLKFPLYNVRRCEEILLDFEHDFVYKAKEERHIRIFQTSSEYTNGEPSGGRLSNNNEIDHLGSVAAKSVLEMGYTGNHVKQAIHKIMQSNNGATDISAVNILSHLLNEEEGNVHGRQSNNSITTEEASKVNILPALPPAHVNETSPTVNGTCETINTTRPTEWNM